MPKKSHVANLDGSYNFPRGFTISDNRIEDSLQRHLSPAEYVVWRQYLRYWGSDKKKAYPSLSKLSEVTGLSEKTIRKCNKELSKKNFMSYIPGGPGRSNRYKYRPIEEILKEYSNEEEVDVNQEQDDDDVIIEYTCSVGKAAKTLESLNTSNLKKVKDFLEVFSKSYSELCGYDYKLDEKDSKVVVKNVKSLDQYTNLIKTFFKTKNKYIEESDKSIYFFFRPSVLKILISEYVSSDNGRWEIQADKYWQKIKDMIDAEMTLALHLAKKEDDLNSWIRENVRLSGANPDRDMYIVSILNDKVKEYLADKQ